MPDSIIVYVYLIYSTLLLMDVQGYGRELIYFHKVSTKLKEKKTVLNHHHYYSTRCSFIEMMNAFFSPFDNRTSLNRRL